MRALRAVPLLTEGKRSTGGTAGLDTVGLSFDVEADFEAKGGVVTISNFGVVGAETVGVRHALPGGGFLALGKGQKAWVEASAKRAGSGSNVLSLTAGQAFESMREACREAEAFCTPAPGHRFENCNVVRLDVVRDFDGVTHVPELLDGLAQVPRDSRWKSRRWADAARNRAETLRVGPKAHGGTLYDKFVETAGEAPAGRLRFESRLHREQLTSQWARDRGLLTPVVASVTDEKVLNLARTCFERYAFDREVVGMASLSSKVFGANGLSRVVQGQLWAFLTAPGYAGMLPRTSRYRYRAIATELGVTLRPGQLEDEAELDPVLVRLDFDRGEEVCRVA